MKVLVSEKKRFNYTGIYTAKDLAPANAGEGLCN
jgi:hypothetical protein